nr:MAG TPA: pepsin inhibitor [Caudoviricetes sp.]
MKAYTNGIIRDMTAEEIAELERLAAELPAPEPTPEERIAALEEALNMLLSGVTE